MDIWQLSQFELTVLQIREGITFITNFNLLNKIPLTKDAPVHNAPIAIGIPVKPNKLVSTIELNGVIPVTGITSPKMTANAYGLLSPTEVIALPICLSTAITLEKLSLQDQM